MVALFVPPDGRLTSQNVFTGPLTGTEVMYIVSPGNADQGNSFQVTTAVLAGLLQTLSTPTILTTGSSYASVATDTRILANLALVSPFTISMLSSASYSQPILIKDIAGTVTGVNTITISFSGGQRADGQSTVVLSAAYAAVWLNPLTAGGFYITRA